MFSQLKAKKCGEAENNIVKSKTVVYYTYNILCLYSTEMKEKMNNEKSKNRYFGNDNDRSGICIHRMQ